MPNGSREVNFEFHTELDCGGVILGTWGWGGSIGWQSSGKEVGAREVQSMPTSKHENGVKSKACNDFNGLLFWKILVCENRCLF